MAESKSQILRWQLREERYDEPKAEPDLDLIRRTKEQKNQEITKDVPCLAAHFPNHPTPSVNSDENKVIIREQPFGTAGNYRPVPVYTLDWTSRSDSHFMPVTGLDFLIGVPEVLLLPTANKLSTSEDRFLVKIPNRETLYMGIENSTSMQRALFCSGRSFTISFLDPTKQEAACLSRRGAFTNCGTCFRQELVVSIPGKKSAIGRIIQNKTISYSIFGESNEELFKAIGSEKTYLRNLTNDVHFSILDPVHRTGEVMLHKWDDNYKDFLYHITFPSCDTPVNHKMLLIGAALLLEFTYFKKSGCLCTFI